MLLRQPAAAGSASGSGSVGKGGTRKLLTDAFELQLDEAGQLLSDATDFTVVGVLGSQGGSLYLLSNAWVGR